jgi:hypothetical protein
MGVDAVLVPVINRPHLDIDGFAAAKGVFDSGEGLIGAQRGLGIERVRGHRGSGT